MSGSFRAGSYSSNFPEISNRDHPVTRRNSAPAGITQSGRTFELTETPFPRPQASLENLPPKKARQGLLMKGKAGLSSLSHKAAGAANNALALVKRRRAETSQTANNALALFKQGGAQTSKMATGAANNALALIKRGGAETSQTATGVISNAMALVKQGGTKTAGSANAIKEGVQQGHPVALYAGFTAIGASLASLVTGLVLLAKTVATEEEAVDEVDEVVDPQDVELEASIKQKKEELDKFEKEHDLNLTDEQLEKNYDRLRYLAEKELHDKLMEDPANVTYGNDSNGRDDPQLRRELEEEVTKAGQNAVDEAKQELQEYREQADQYRRELDDLEAQQKLQPQDLQQNPQNSSTNNSTKKAYPVAAPALLGASAGLGMLGAVALYRPIKDKVLDPAGKAAKNMLRRSESINKGQPASKPKGDLDIPSAE